CYIYPLYLSPLRKIPGPPVNNFILGHFASFLNQAVGDAHDYLAKKYGGIARYHGLFNKPHISISDPKLVQQVLVNHSYDYPRYFVNRNETKKFFGSGILIAEGDSHKRQRKMMNPSFAFANVKMLLALLICRFNYEFNSTTSDSELAKAYRTLFGGNPSPLFVAFVNILPFIRKLRIIHNNQFYDSIKIINNISEKLIAEQKNASVRGKDLLFLLVKENESLPVYEQLTHEELVSQVVILLAAGHETTSTALSWALYFLAKYPDIQDCLRKEVLGVFTDRNHFPTIDEIDQLKYLEWYAIDDFYIRYPSSPFNLGAGPKNCLGMKMAHLELKSILSVIIRNFEFRLVEGFTFKKKLSGFAKPIPGIDLFVSKVDY
ncbi:29902_t:CDS:2, partial [Gigaspora margarita]